jgi:homogentisate 1,2-dioxygenase
MEIPYVRGKVAQQAHVGLPEGTVEEEYARNGFFGRYAHLYRTEAPVGWTRIEGPMRPRAYELERAVGGSAERGGRTEPPRRIEASADPADPGTQLGRRLLFFNADVRLSWASADTPWAFFYRNADADEVLFVHRGAGRLETDFGPLTYEPGDYLVVPRGTVQRLVPTSPTRLFVTESVGEVRFPDRGMLGQHALFDPAVIIVPSPDEPSSAKADAAGEFTAPGVEVGGPLRGRSRMGRGERVYDSTPNGVEFELRVVRAGETTKIFYPFCPINTVGWKGTLTALKLRVRDIRPVSSDRYHLPPSAHTTFVMQNAVICTFAPRPLENGDPAALKVPFYHSNIDFDEVLFYHSGNFFSREGISPGMLTMHPQGIHHGPQAGAEARAKGASRTEEVAIMVDTKNPLHVATTAAAYERADSWKSWSK